MFTPQMIVQTVLLFFVLVSIHEWGHYYFAKRAGILVREFAIGFGPKLFSYKRGETRFTLRLLPIGGFVRMAGEDPEMVQVTAGQTLIVEEEKGVVTRFYLDQLDARPYGLRGEVVQIDLERQLFVTLDVDGDVQRFAIDPQAMIVARGAEVQIAPWNRQFGSKTVPQRALSIFAGPVMNFLLAFVLFFIFVLMRGIPVENPDKVAINTVVEKSPAEAAGLKKGDVLVSVNGVAVGGDSEWIRNEIAASADKKMDWVVLRNNNQVELEITPRLDQGVSRIGILFDLETRPAKFGETLSLSWEYMTGATKQILLSFKKLVTGQFVMDDLGGPVKMVQVTGQFAKQGWTDFVSWGALLSLYLGIFNLLPFPALDGSRLVFLGIEGLRGKPVDPSKESVVHFIGFAMLMLLMLAVTYNDILSLFRGS